MTGAETTSLSRTMAIGRPMFSLVACPKRWAPRRLNLKLTIGSWLCWSKAGCASVSSLPSAITRRSTGTLAPLPSLEGSMSTSPEGLSASMRNSSLAVEPRSFSSRSGFCSPGTWIRMRSAPCCWIEGSVVPVESRRRRMTSMPWLTARRVRSTMPASVRVRRTTPPGCSVTSRVRAPVWPMAVAMGAARSRSFAGPWPAPRRPSPSPARRAGAAGCRRRRGRSPAGGRGARRRAGPWPARRPGRSDRLRGAMRTALEVEAEHDGPGRHDPVREPRRQAREEALPLLRREEARHGERQPHQDDREGRGDLRTGEAQHRRIVSLDWPAACASLLT